MKWWRILTRDNQTTVARKLENRNIPNSFIFSDEIATESIQKRSYTGLLVQFVVRKLRIRS